MAVQARPIEKPGWQRPGFAAVHPVGELFQLLGPGSHIEIHRHTDEEVTVEARGMSWQRVGRVRAATLGLALEACIREVKSWES